MDLADGAGCDGHTLAFRLPDPDRHLAGVRLAQHVGLPADRLEFGYDESAGAWRLELPRPSLWRLEYLFELRHPDGTTELVCDPHNPRRVGGAFGDKSVLECPGYAEPGWLHRPAAAGSWRELAIPAPLVGGEVWARIWSPDRPSGGERQAQPSGGERQAQPSGGERQAQPSGGERQAQPSGGERQAQPTDRVLLAHDGPEYDKIASLGHYSAALQGGGELPAHHLVLLAPGERDEWYSANPAYALTLVAGVLPRLRAELGVPDPALVAVGASLGGLAMLHAQRRHPRVFAGMFLQSGSFFQARHDSQESRFVRYARITRFVNRVLRAAGGPPTPAVLTCGLVEENLHNNRDMARTLRRQGYPAELVEVPDGHNYIAWRDAFDPHLTDLLRRVWRN